MKQQSKSLLFCLLASTFLILSCEKEGDQFNCSPLEASYTTTIETLAPPPMLQQRVTATGNSAFLGASRHEAMFTVNLTTPPPFEIAGTGTFYAADGEAFYTVYTGTASPNSDGTSSIVINHAINGGTGRFRHATGRLVANSIADPIQPTGLTTLEGYICN